MRWLLLTAAAHQAAGAAPLGEDAEDASSQLRAEPPKASGELLEPPPALKDVQAAVDALGKIDLGRDLAALQQAVAGTSFAELGVATPAPTPKCGGYNHDYQCDGTTDNMGDPGCGGDGICHERQECTKEDGSSVNGCFCTATSCPSSLQTGNAHVMCHGADCVQLHSGQCRSDDDCSGYGSGVICDSDPHQARSVGCCITTPDADGHAHIVSLAEQAEAVDVPSGVTLLHHPNCAALARSAHHVPQDDAHTHR